MRKGRFLCPCVVFGAVQRSTVNKLRKRILVEDQSLEDVVKLGLAYEQSSNKADAMERKDDYDKSVRRLVEEEIA